MNLSMISNLACVGEITPELRETAAALCSAADYVEREFGSHWFQHAVDAVEVGDIMLDPAACLARVALWSSPARSWLEAEAMLLSGWTP